MPAAVNHTAAGTPGAYGVVGVVGVVGFVSPSSVLGFFFVFGALIGLGSLPFGTKMALTPRPKMVELPGGVPAAS